MPFRGDFSLSPILRPDQYLPLPRRVVPWFWVRVYSALMGLWRVFWPLSAPGMHGRPAYSLAAACAPLFALYVKDLPAARALSVSLFPATVSAVLSNLTLLRWLCKLFFLFFPGRG